MLKVCLFSNAILLFICIIMFVGTSTMDFLGHKNVEKGVQVSQQVDGKTELIIATAADSSREVETTSGAAVSLNEELASWTVDLDPRWSDFRTGILTF